MENIKSKFKFSFNQPVDEENVDIDYKTLTAWGKFKYRFNHFLDAIHFIRCICCFTSVFSVLATLVLIFGGSDSLAGAFLLIGLPSAILACPFKFIGITGALIIGGFSIGLCFLGFGCVIGAVIVLILALLLLFFCPAFVTIPYFFNELRYKR